MDVSLNYIVLGHTVFNCLAAIWAAFVFFRRDQKPEKRTWLVRICFLISLAVTVAIGLSSQFTSFNLAIIGEILIAISTFIFFWSIRSAKQLAEVYSPDPPVFLVVNGPYKYIRNPFYLSYILNYFGAAIGLASPLLFGQSCLMAWLYYRAAKFEEAKFNHSSLCSQYESFVNSTGMFLPNPYKILRKK